MTRYMGWLKDERGLEFDDYAALWEWSTDDLEAFWALAVGVLRRRRPPTTRCWPTARCRARSGSPAPSSPIPSTSSATAPATAWRSATPPSCATPASGRGTSCAPRPRACAPACRRWASSAATASSPTCRTSPRRSPRSSRSPALGAVWSSCSPDFGARSVVDRFAQIEPKVLLAVDGYRYGGKDHDRGELIEKRPGRDAVARAHGDARLPRPATRATGTTRSRRPTRSSSSTASRSTTRCGSSTRRAPPACRRRSCTRRAGSCSSTSRSTTSTSTPRRATASSGSPRRAG